MDTKEDILELSEKIARQAHAGQYDKAGNEYITHPQFVAGHVKTRDEKCVAWLHDVVEDTDVTLEDLLRKGIPENIVNAVDAITKREGEEYDDYLKRVAENELALNVKLADMTHNMDMKRIPNPNERDLDRLEKYKRGMAYLKAFLQE